MFGQVNLNPNTLKPQAVQTVIQAVGSVEQQAYQQERSLRNGLRIFPLRITSWNFLSKIYRVRGYDVDTFMKQVLIPALSQVIDALPTGWKVVVEGHANAVGPKEHQDGKQGSIALSKACAKACDEARLEYILRNSKFMIWEMRSSRPLVGVQSQSVKNYCVSFDTIDGLFHSRKGYAGKFSLSICTPYL